MLTSAGEAAAQVPADLAELGSGAVELVEELRRGTPPRRAGQPIAFAIASAPTSVSQHPWLPQWHSPTVGAVEHVADLAGVPTRPLQGHAADDQTRTDPDLAGEVDEVVHSDSRAPQVLGERAEVGVVSQ